MGKTQVSKTSADVLFRIAIFCVVVANARANSAALNDTDREVQLANETRNLQAANEAWQRCDAAYRKFCKQDQALESEVREYAAFVAELKLYTIEGCEAVRKLGGDVSQYSDLAEELEDEQESQKGSDKAYAKRGLTREEKKALVVKEYDEIVKKFDTLIRKEQAKISGDPVNGQQNADWAGGSNGTPDANETAGSGVLGDGTVGEEKEEEAEPGAGPGVIKPGKIPDFAIEGVGDSRDDDIIARQLREAAESETDKELKAQLWDEYKKYTKTRR